MFSFLKQELGRIKSNFRVFRYKQKFPHSKIQSHLNTYWEGKLREYSIIEHGCILKGQISYLGRGLYIGNNTLIYSCDHIGDFCSISSDVKIGLIQHPKDRLSTSPLFYSSGRGLIDKTSFDDSERRAWIGHDVLISANALVLNGVKIGNGAIIGAAAVVTKDVAPYAIVAGVPAKVIGYRFDEKTIEALLKSEWWKLNLSEITRLPYLNNANLIVQQKI